MSVRRLLVPALAVTIAAGLRVGRRHSPARASRSTSSTPSCPGRCRVADGATGTWQVGPGDRRDGRERGAGPSPPGGPSGRPEPDHAFVTGGPGSVWENIAATSGRRCSFDDDRLADQTLDSVEQTAEGVVLAGTLAGGPEDEPAGWTMTVAPGPPTGRRCRSAPTPLRR